MEELQDFLAQAEGIARKKEEERVTKGRCQAVSDCLRKLVEDLADELRYLELEQVGKWLDADTPPDDAELTLGEVFRSSIKVLRQHETSTKPAFCEQD